MEDVLDVNTGSKYSKYRAQRKRYDELITVKP